jgi:hypothetical protein
MKNGSGNTVIGRKTNPFIYFGERITSMSTAVPDKLVSEEMLEGLPEPVQRYLTYTGVIDKPWVHSVFLKQTGRFRQSVDQPWMPMAAEQTYSVDPPGFVWDARFKMAGLPLLRARDAYEDGHGHMYGKLAGLFTVFDVRGEQLDQGAMLRYLSEMIWFPSAFLGDNISWESLDDHSARVTLSDRGKEVSGVLYFDTEGRVTNFTTQRYREVDGDFSLDPWSTPIGRYGTLAGLNLPVTGKAMWNLPAGDLDYVELEITELVYNSTP